MIEYPCPACKALAFSSASELHVGGCPSCGARLGEGEAQPSLRETVREQESIPLHAAPAEMNMSVRAARRGG
jgi:predicted  nucleic acid-binding Zn-ribbon protein